MTKCKINDNILRLENFNVKFTNNDLECVLFIQLWGIKFIKSTLKRTQWIIGVYISFDQ